MADNKASFFEQEIERLLKEDPLRADHYVNVRQSKVFMEKHFGGKISLDDLARAACMSRFHYVRMFQRMYGITPRIFLRDLRVAKAKELICKGFSITQVCLEVGYESLPTFSSAFKKCTGYSPRQYRRMQKSNLE